jgi:hypothetical protein
MMTHPMEILEHRILKIRGRRGTKMIVKEMQLTQRQRYQTIIALGRQGNGGIS